MKKNKFIKTTIIIVIGGLISKILGMLTKIVNTKIIGDAGIALYMLVMPTFSLLISLSQLGFPIAVSTLVAKDKDNNKKIVSTTTIMAILITIVLMISVFLLSPFISKLLGEEKTYYPLIAISLTLPFISLSSIIRGYFFGKEKMFPNVFSNVLEQIIRLILIVVITPKLLSYSLTHAVIGTILYNIVSETLSIVVLIFFIPKKSKFHKDEFKFNKKIAKDVLNISLPTTGSRLIGSFSYFLEPIILTFVLSKVGYSHNYIVGEYGIITGYVFPLLLLPSFFSYSISSALVPVISKAYSNNKKKYVISKIKQACLFSFSIGLIFTIFLMFKAEFALNFVYNTKLGANYIRILAPLFLIHYLQSPINSSLQAIGKAKESMNSTLISAIIKIILLFTLSWLKIGMVPLLIATVVNIIFVTFYNYKKLKKILYAK